MATLKFDREELDWLLTSVEDDWANNKNKACDQGYLHTMPKLISKIRKAMEADWAD
jgi:hypothetical protein